MSARSSILATIFVALLAVRVAADDYSPQPQDQLRPMLKITWSRGPNLPQGFQDSDGGFIGDTLITAGGFCSGDSRSTTKRSRAFIRAGSSTKRGRWISRQITAGGKRFRHSPASVGKG